MIDNFCAFFKAIEDDPSKIIKGLRIRDLYLAKEHLNNCYECYNRSERVLAKAPKPKIEDNYNVN